jgi:hypothetical protein
MTAEIHMTDVQSNGSVTSSSGVSNFDPSKHVRLDKCNGKDALNWVSGVLEAIEIIGSSWTDAEKCFWFGQHLTGDARTWYRFYKEQCNLLKQPLVFDDVISRFRAYYCRDVTTLQAKQRFDQFVMRSGTSVSQYARAFKALAIEARVVHDDELVEKFIRGLRGTVQRELRLRAALGQLDSMSFDDIVRAAEHFDVADRFVERTSSAPYSRSGGSHSSGGHDGGQRSNRRHGSGATHQANHMGSNPSSSRSSEPVAFNFQRTITARMTKEGDHYLPRINPVSEAQRLKRVWLYERPPSDAADGEWFQHTGSTLWAPDKFNGAKVCRFCLYIGHSKSGCQASKQASKGNDH